MGDVFTVGMTGGRDHEGQALIWGTFDELLVDVLGEYDRLRVRHGACYPRKTHGHRPIKSADYLTHLWCQTQRHVVDEVEYPADWAACSRLCPDKPHRKVGKGGGEYCPLAGDARNQDMVDEAPVADLWLAFPTPTSRGTWDCVRRAEAAGIEVRAVKP